MGDDEMDDFKDYLARIENPDHRARTKEVLDWVGGTFPQLRPKITWNQPMFTDHGTFIIGFSVSKTHLAAAPEREGILRFSRDIAHSGYDHSQQLFRIKWGQWVDYALLRKIIAFNIEEKAACKTFWRKSP